MSVAIGYECTFLYRYADLSETGLLTPPYLLVLIVNNRCRHSEILYIVLSKQINHNLLRLSCFTCYGFGQRPWVPCSQPGMVASAVSGSASAAATVISESSVNPVPPPKGGNSSWDDPNVAEKEIGVVVCQATNNHSAKPVFKARRSMPVDMYRRRIVLSVFSGDTACCFRKPGRR